MSEFCSVRPFLIDNGELDQVETHDAFVLGYELCMFDRLMETGEAFRMPIARIDNLQRMKSYAKDLGRTIEAKVSPDDESEAYMTVLVGPGSKGIEL